MILPGNDGGGRPWISLVFVLDMLSLKVKRRPLRVCVGLYHRAYASSPVSCKYRGAGCVPVPSVSSSSFGSVCFFLKCLC